MRKVHKSANNGDDTFYPFREWLDKQMRKKGWNQTQLARQLGGTARSTISSWLSKKSQRRPSPDGCVNIAAALDIPPETVLAIAGYVQPPSNLDGKLAHLMSVARQLSSDDLTMAIEVMEAIARVSEQGETIS